MADDAPSTASPRAYAKGLAGGCLAALLAVVVMAAVVPSPDRFGRGLLIVVAVVLLLGVGAVWLRTVRLLAPPQNTSSTLG